MPFYTSPADTYNNHYWNTPRETYDNATTARYGATIDSSGPAAGQYASDTIDTRALATTEESGVGYGQVDPSEFGPGYGQLDPYTFGPGYGQQDPAEFGPGYGQQDPSEFGPGYGQLDPGQFASSSGSSTDDYGWF